MCHYPEFLIIPKTLYEVSLTKFGCQTFLASNVWGSGLFLTLTAFRELKEDVPLSS